jgi:hypothetical protein
MKIDPNTGERDYGYEYRNYHSKSVQKIRRAKRNAARRKLQASGRVHKGDGKDVDHKDRNPHNNSNSNLSVKSKSANRARNQTFREVVTFKTFTESSAGEVCEPSNEPISKSQLKDIERVLDKLFSALNIDVEFTKHFFDRLNDPRNKKQITVCELIEIYKELYKKYGVKISKTGGGKEIDRLVTSISTSINIPLAVRYNRNTKEVEMAAKTIMRKKGFKSDHRTNQAKWTVA